MCVYMYRYICMCVCIYIYIYIYIYMSTQQDVTLQQTQKRTLAGARRSVLLALGLRLLHSWPSSCGIYIYIYIHTHTCFIYFLTGDQPAP